MPFTLLLWLLRVIAIDAFITLQHVSDHAPQLALTALSNDDGDMVELYRRINTLAASEQVLEQTSTTTSNRLKLPVVCFDALLPNQKLEARTTDETFANFLASLGLGGLFCMTSVNQSKRMLRRNGVLAKIELVDARYSTERIPTAVDFVIRGLRHVRVTGPSQGLKARVGRWRRQYDDNGEEAVLGWGEERFVDAFANATSERSEDVDYDMSLPHTEWSLCEVECSIQDADANDGSLQTRIDEIIPLLERWKTLASDVATFENTDVVATARVMKGQPGLAVDPAALIRSVEKELGEMPLTNPTEFAFWGAALVNPLPVLGVSPEIRGRILEAPDASSRLAILKWGVERSIRNLEGTDPL